MLKLPVIFLMWQILFCLVWIKLLFDDIRVFTTDSFKMLHNLNGETVDKTCGRLFSCVYTPATSTNVFVNSETTPSMATLLSPAQFVTPSCIPTMTITTQHITTPTVTCSDTYHCQPLHSPKCHMFLCCFISYVDIFICFISYVEQQCHMFCHNNEQYTIPSQHHAAVSLPYRHPAHSPRTDKFYAQTPATTGHNYPRHPSAITSGPTEFCWYHNTFGPRAIKCSLGCTFSQQTKSKPLNYQGGVSNLAPPQTLL